MGYNDELNEIGIFEVKSGVLYISDPCYNKNTWCAKTVPGVKNGKYKAFTQQAECGDWGNRVARLYAIHESIEINELINIDFQIIENLGVDSGQLGVFDYEMFMDDSQFPAEFNPQFTYQSEKPEIFYRACCDITLSDEKAGVIPFGCVSSSGYGDGVYNANVYYKDNEVYAVEIVFIEEDECDD